MIGLIGAGGKHEFYPVEDADSDWADAIIAEWLKDAFAFGHALQLDNVPAD